MDENIVPHNKKWLVVFLVYSDFTANKKLPMIDKMKIALNSMLGDILTTSIDSKRSRVFVIINSIKFFLDEQENKIDDRTLFYEIESTDNEAQNQITKCELVKNEGYYKPDANGKLKLQHPEQLKDILERIKVADNEEILLVTWDHGSVFGIFRKEPVTLAPDLIRKEIDKNLSQYPYLGLFWQHALQADKDNFFNRQEQASNIKYTVFQQKGMLFKFKNESENIDKARFYQTNKELNNYYAIEQVDKNSRQYKLSVKAVPEASMHILSQASAESKGMVEALLGDASMADLPLSNDVAEILKNDELALVITDWLAPHPNDGKARKVGVLLMSNCWMMNMHTMWAFRHTVKCLVAPQGDIDCPGYNYRDILLLVNDNSEPFLSPQELAAKCVETSENVFARAKATILNSEEPQIIDVFKIFAVNLEAKEGDDNLLEKQLEALNEFIEELLSQLNDEFIDKELRFLLKYVRSVCFDFSNNITMVVDITNWMLSILYADEDFKGKFKPKFFPAIQNPYKKFRDLILRKDPSIILGSTTGKNIYDGEDPAKPIAVINLPPTGYSLFFPQVGMQEVPELIDNVKSDGLLLKGLPRWKDFLIKMDPDTAHMFGNPGS